uniref:Uncharacterized protein n=1 Tax=Sarcophilus harrisii TaxID=9305 RepID=A0A7N4P8J5_SARHA
NTGQLNFGAGSKLIVL